MILEKCWRCQTQKTIKGIKHDIRDDYAMTAIDTSCHVCDAASGITLPTNEFYKIRDSIIPRGGLKVQLKLFQT